MKRYRFLVERPIECDVEISATSEAEAETLLKEGKGEYGQETYGPAKVIRVTQLDTDGQDTGRAG